MAPGTGSTGPDDTGRGGTGPGGNGRPRPPAGKPAPKAGKPVPKAGPATGRPAGPPSAKPQAAPAPAARPAGSKPAPARPQPAKATPPRPAAASSGGKRPVTATTSSSSRRRLPAAALGAGALAIGLVLGVAAYAGWAAVADDDEPTRAAAQVSRASEPSSAEPSSADPSGADPSGSTDGSSTDGSAASTTEPVDDRTERCARAASALAEPLRAARPALDQWDVHVGAMNKLVTGAITLQQANAFWNRTRVGAHDRVKGFQDADKALRRAGVDCPAPAFLGDADPDLRACSRLVADELRVLQVADTAVDTWAVHVHHMEMLREGTMSPEEATRLWLSMWQRGVRQLDAYRAAARDLRSADACPGATGD